jgi:arylsulfatase A-like enzyme
VSNTPFNVLIVLADQHNASLLGCGGHPQVKTPHLDAFAAGGVRFTQAYCQNTICTPSRVSILSGQYCHNHGYYGLSGPTNPGLPNLMRRFRSAGYRTAGFGKLHLPDSPRNWLADDLDLFADTYERADGERGSSAFLDELEALGLREWEDSWHNPWHYGSGTISLDAQPSKLPYEHTQEFWCARQAMEFIAAEPNRPFCVQIAFQKPHHPLLPQQRFWDMYPADLALPPTFALEPAQRPPHFQRVWHNFRRIRWDYAEPGETFADGARRAWRGTLACISQIDDMFGMLLRFLHSNGLAERTIVVYGSDHGGYHTIHGMPEKAPGICSDAVCRVPLIMQAPGVTKPAVCDELVEMIDLAPTLTSLCGLAPMEWADGVDLAPLLAGGKSPVHEVALTENAWSKALRWGPWRMVHYPREMFGEDVGELYRIAEDPGETRNLYYDPAYRDVVEEGRRLLLDKLIGSTRLVTMQPTIVSSQTDRLRGTRTYPVCSDGRAPNSAHPSGGDQRALNYL